MSVDYSKVKGLSDSIGNIVKITDLAGNVLWAAVKMVNLTITSFWDGMDGDTARITINSPSPFAPDPSNPSNKVTSWTAYVYDLFDQQNRTIKIPVGSTIECYITRDKGNADSYIKLNGVSVATGEGTYVYTVTGDATIDVSEEYVQGDYGVISITGAVTYISFTANGETYQAIEGMNWKSWFASTYNTTGMTKGKVTDANGNEISLDTVIVNGTEYVISPVIGSLPVGTTVTITMFGNQKRDFLIVHQGNPSTTYYDESCNGTWLLYKNVFTTRAWDSTYMNGNNYATSSIHSYLNNDVLSNFDDKIKSTIKQVKIPYTNGKGSSGKLAYGENGLSTKLFLLSVREVLGSTYTSDVNLEGAQLDYFKSNKISSENSWCTRSPRKGTDFSVFSITNTGWISYSGEGSNYEIRFALILPSSACVDESYHVIG